MTDINHRALERIWTFQSLVGNPDEEHFRSKALAHTARRPFAQGDQAVIWELPFIGQDPYVLAVVTFGDLDTLGTEGLRQDLAIRDCQVPGVECGSNMTLTHIPQRVPGTAGFLWLPYFNNLNYTPPNWEQPGPMSLRCDVVAKFHSGRRDATAGQQVFEPARTFCARYPNLLF